MRIDSEVCREFVLSKYTQNGFYNDLIRSEIKTEVIEKIQIEDEFIRVYLAEGGNNIFWTIEYKEYCEFVNDKRQQKLERICNEL